MKGPIRTFVDNLNKLNANPQLAIDVLIELAEREGTEFFNSAIEQTEQTADDDARVVVNGCDVTDVYDEAYLDFQRGRSMVHTVKAIRGAAHLSLRDAKEVAEEWWGEFAHKTGGI